MTNPDDEATEYPLGPSLEFMQQLWQLNHSLERISRSMERRLGVTAPQRLILRAVGKYPGITAGQLARLLHVDPGTVSAALNRLDEKGLVDRRRDPRDKRRAALGLTAKGRALGLPAAGTVERAVELMLDELSATDVETTRAVIGRLTTLLDAQIPP